MSNVINIYQTEEDIMVKINKWDLVQVAAMHPEWPLRVLQLQKFIDAVVYEMNHYQDQNCQELGISYLENAMDKFIQEAAENNPSVAEPIEWQNDD